MGSGPGSMKMYLISRKCVGDIFLAIYSRAKSLKNIDKDADIRNNVNLLLESDCNYIFGDNISVSQFV